MTSHMAKLMNVLPTTEVSGGQASFSPLRQVEQQLTVGLFQRAGADVGQRGFSFFTDAEDGGAIWDGNRLRIRLGGKTNAPGQMSTYSGMLTLIAGVVGLSAARSGATSC